MGLIFGQARVAGVDNGVTGLSLGAVESRLDRPVARARIQALELDRYTVYARIGCASVDSEAFGHRNYRRTGARKVLRDSAGRMWIVLPALLARFCGGAGVGSGAWVPA